jgi:hypothetical protein
MKIGKLRAKRVPLEFLGIIAFFTVICSKNETNPNL